MTNRLHSQYPSIKLDQLVYVELPSNNGGMMLSVSEEGFNFRAVTPVAAGGPVSFSFATNGFDKLAGYGKIDWVQDDGKIAGLQFTEVSAEFKSGLRKWLRQMSAPVTPPFAPSSSLSAPGASFDERATGVEPKKTRVSEFSKILNTQPVKPANVPAADGLPPGFQPFGIGNPNVTPAEPPNSQPAVALPMFREWEYPKDLDQSRSRISRVVIWAIGICFAVLAIGLYGYHQYVGQSLISLGHQISVPPSPPPPQSAAKPGAVSKFPVDKGQPTAADNLRPQNQSASESEPTTPGGSGTISRSGQLDTPPATPSDTPPTASSRTYASANPQAAESRVEGQHSEQSHALWTAVAHGDTAAEVTLAELYLIGAEGVTKSCVQARILLQAAAKKGNGAALSKLAQLNRQGCP